MTPGCRLRYRNVYWQALAVVLAVVGATCLVLASAQSTLPPASGTDTGRTLDEVPSTVPVKSAPAAQIPVHPVKLEIPSLGLATPLIRLGLQADGTVEVPRDAGVAGWFRRGPAPGALGASVILGHVDSVQGPGVFFRLDELAPGDRVTVQLDDGSTVRFEVRSVRTYPNAEFPAQRVYGHHGRSELNLVTCGGTYDADRGGYQANVVVNAHKVSAF